MKELLPLPEPNGQNWLDEYAQAAYEAYCDSMEYQAKANHLHLPKPWTWAEMNGMTKDAWRAAAQAVICLSR